MPDFHQNCSEGEHGPATDPDGWWRQRSWWRGSPGPVTDVGPAEQRDEDYASAKEDLSSSSFDEGDSDAEWEGHTPARPGCQVSGNMSVLPLYHNVSNILSIL